MLPPPLLEFMQLPPRLPFAGRYGQRIFLEVEPPFALTCLAEQDRKPIARRRGERRRLVLRVIKMPGLRALRPIDSQN
jgi:hypothetical protein